MTKLKFKVNALRTLPSPYKSKNKDIDSLETIYYLLVNMKDLPEKIPLDVNPRVPKMGTNVAKRLLNAVVEPENDFYINNRGIVISANIHIRQLWKRVMKFLKTSLNMCASK